MEQHSASGKTKVAVIGGSNSYVKTFTASFTGTLHLSSEVRRITRMENGVQAQFVYQQHETFDQVVLVTHADQSIRLLGDPTPEKNRLLSSWQYEKNHAVLHTDQCFLPPMHRAWACWNFRRESIGAAVQPAYVNYAVNLLQGLTTNKQYLVTLNRPNVYPEKHVVVQMDYHHPSYTNASMATQAGLPTLNGVKKTWFCGNYFGSGFHEDAVRSSYQAVAHLRKTAL